MSDKGAPDAVIDGRYRIERELARGSMGKVLLAYDESLERQVAIKLIAPEAHALADFEARFRREAAALARVRNDHVVQVHALGRHEGALFFAMELVVGKSLEEVVRDHLSHGTYVPLRTALGILRMIASGLAAVHAARLVHRDVKPSNVVIETSTGRPVLVDFGLARKIEGAAKPRLPLIRTKGLGTPAYAAPEQIGGDVDAHQITERTDVYALACTAFELLTGDPPFVEEDPYAVMQRHARDKAPSPSTRRVELAPFDAVFERALSKAPSERYPGALEFVDALFAVAPIDTTSEPGVASVSSRVLVVDSDLAFAARVSTFAKAATASARVEVHVAGRAEDALAWARQGTPSFVFLAPHLADATGVELLTLLRDLPRGFGLHAVVVGSGAQKWRYGVLGVADFLEKPLDDALLRVAVHGLFVRAGLLQG